MIDTNVFIPERFKGVEPFFSIIVVSYNSFRTLPRTMNAIKKQSYDNYEIVFVNNGSTDKTDKYIKWFIKNNPNIYLTYVKIDKNDGLPLGRNQGIINAHGKYLIFNDADDWMEKDCLKEMYKASDDGRVDRIVVQFRDVTDEGKILQTRSYTNNMSRFFLTLLQGNALKRDIFVKHNIFVPDTFMDDMYLTLGFSSYTSSYVVVRKTLYNFRINYNSTSGINSITDINRIVGLLDDLISCIDSIRHNISLNEWPYLEYQLIKCYYNLIFNYNRKRSASDMKKVYKQMREMMKKYDRDYLKNPLIKLLSNNGDRLYGRLITYFASKAERFHIMLPLLYLYVFFSKFVYFRI